MTKQLDPTTVPEGETRASKPILDVLAEHPFLSGLKPAYLAALEDNSLRMTFQPGEVIFREGDPANRFYLIETGKVSLESNPRNSPPMSIQVIGPGDVLGWSWLFPPYYWHFDACAIEPTTVIFFYGTRLRQQCEDNHDLGYELMKRMAAIAIGRLQATRKQLVGARDNWKSSTS